MGPTNVALMKLYEADTQLRSAQERLDAAARNVRIQERRVADLAEKLKLAQTSLREQQARAGQLDLDLRSRDAHIEKLRTQQQSARNNKEYQTFLIEINTGKVDRAKVEEEAVKVMESVEKAKAEATALAAHVETERAKLATMRAQISDTIAKLQQEVEALRPARDAAAAAVPPKGREAFERLAARFDGEVMAAIDKPDRRREEYLCTACNMELVRDVYNKLRTRDELVFCPSCQRILYIPEHFSPDVALGTGKGGKAGPVKRATTTRPPKAKAPKAAKAPSEAAADAGEAAPDAGGEPGGPAPVYIEQRAKGDLGRLLAAAQGESTKMAADADQKPIECEVYVNGDLAGIYKGKSVENLSRVIKFRMDEAKVSGNVEVRQVPAEEEEPGSPPAQQTGGASTDEPVTFAADVSRPEIH